LTLVGPRAGRLLDDAGLPTTSIGGVAESWFAGGPVLLVREAGERFLLVVDADRAVDVWQELFEVGRTLGLSMVGAEALDRLAAAPRAGIF
jgi:glycine cleavage system aminomethyltransferase T